jgi:DNA-binding XRE family transcriptional regulator
MQNTILVLLRNSKHYRKSQVAAKLGITYQEYVAIENGEEMMTYEIAKQLGKLYSIKGKICYEAARQLDLLITRGEVIKHLNDENKRMDALLEGGYELLHSSKLKASSHENFTDCRPATN